MKRTLLLVAGVMALGTAIYLTGHVGAQGNAAAAPKTKVGLLNLTYVIKNYNKFKNFQEDLKKTVEPFQTKDTGLKTEGEKIAKEAQTPATTAARREAIEKRLKEIQRDIEDNKNEAQKVVVKKQEDQLKILYMDVRGIVERYAQAHGFEMVLHYNDATTQEEYWSPTNIARKMQAGALMPMYMANGLDISANIVATLNAAAPGAGTGTATGTKQQ